MKFFARYLFLFALLVVPILFMPLPAAAGLVPCGTEENPEACTLCHILIGGKGLIDWGMGAMVVIGIGLIMVSGIVYITAVGDSGRMTTAKGMIGKVIGGLMLILTGWLIINTIITILASNDMGVGVRKENWYTFTCDSQSTANTSGGTGQNLVSKPSLTSGGLDCNDPGASGMRRRVTSGGAVCSGTTYACPKCNPADLAKWRALIDKHLPAGMPVALADAVMAKESSCNPNPGAMDGKSCGLMQIKFENFGQANCTSPRNLNDPETNIIEGLKILKKAWDDSATYATKYAAAGIKREEIAYVIYNSGTKDVAQSSDCKNDPANPEKSWPVDFPRYACPINPGTAQYNACYIREQSCKVAACF